MNLEGEINEFKIEDFKTAIKVHFDNLEKIIEVKYEGDLTEEYPDMEALNKSEENELASLVLTSVDSLKKSNNRELVLTTLFEGLEEMNSHYNVDYYGEFFLLKQIILKL